jgi:hypothetical protein
MTDEARWRRRLRTSQRVCACQKAAQARQHQMGPRLARQEAHPVAPPLPAAPVPACAAPELVSQIAAPTLVSHATAASRRSSCGHIRRCAHASPVQLAWAQQGNRSRPKAVVTSAVGGSPHGDWASGLVGWRGRTYRWMRARRATSLSITGWLLAARRSTLSSKYNATCAQ